MRASVMIDSNLRESARAKIKVDLLCAEWA